MKDWKVKTMVIVLGWKAGTRGARYQDDFRKELLVRILLDPIARAERSIPVAGGRCGKNRRNMSLNVWAGKRSVEQATMRR
jgi:hypothetical protein